MDIVPIKNEKGEVVLFLVSHKDITREKESEDDLSDTENSISGKQRDRKRKGLYLARALHLELAKHDREWHKYLSELGCDLESSSQTTTSLIGSPRDGKLENLNDKRK